MTTNQTKKGCQANLTDLILGGLVATLSVMAALLAYLSNQHDATSNDLYFESQTANVEANSLYIEASQNLIFDYQLYNDWVLADDPDVAEFYFNQLTIEAQDSAERPNGPFDDQYYDELYYDADTLYAEGKDLADRAKIQGAIADEYQLAVLILAVGLSFTGWASLINTKFLQWVFIVLSGLALAFSIIQFLVTWATT